MTLPQLTAEECRVLGCLVEKHLTTPQQYPLTLNALTLACNQSTNRDPVVAYDEPVVQGAVTSLKERGLARFVHPSHGRSVLRFRHVIGEALAVDEGPSALLAVLMLRGPQTPGELRTRTERMAAFADVGAVEAALDALGARADPLVARLGRQPGQKEDRYAHLLGRGAEGRVPLSPLSPLPRVPPLSPVPAGEGWAPVADAPERVPAPSPAVAEGELAGEVARLRAELDQLRRDVDGLRRDLGD